jgi:hypothetical protein
MRPLCYSYPQVKTPYIQPLPQCPRDGINNSDILSSEPLGVFEAHRMSAKPTYDLPHDSPPSFWKYWM